MIFKNRLFSLNKTNTVLTLSSFTLLTGLWYYRTSIKQQFTRSKSTTTHHKGTMTNDDDDEPTEEDTTEENNTAEEVVVTKEESTFRLFR